MTGSTKVPLPLDGGFVPLAALARGYFDEAEKSGSKRRFLCALRRSEDLVSVWEAPILPDGEDGGRNVSVLGRIVQSLLWIRGGYEISTAGSEALHRFLKDAYRPGGLRAFDAAFMSDIYGKPFRILFCKDPDDVPRPAEAPLPVGRNLRGCRVGFDAGGSDRKVSAVIDGRPVFSEEVVWHPKLKEDPFYHFEEVLSAVRRAADHLPRLDAIGVSTAGIVIENRLMASSLFMKVPRHIVSARGRDLYLDVAREMGGVPIQVANDGDVTALAGAMSLEEGRILGIAMGTSEAGGYVDENMRIMGWLNELAFVPLDESTNGAVSGWSGDMGCGAEYLSQDAVIRLAPRGGIALDPALSPAEKLKRVQELMRDGNEGARAVFETVGAYFGHALALYALFYPIRHVLVLGRVTSGAGGALLVDRARQVLAQEYPTLAASILIHLPDEASRRVGQSVAAASLPPDPPDVPQSTDV